MIESLTTQFDAILSSVDFVMVGIVCAWFLSGWLLNKLQERLEGANSQQSLDVILCVLLGPGTLILIVATLAASMLDADVRPPVINTTTPPLEERRPEGECVARVETEERKA